MKFIVPEILLEAQYKSFWDIDNGLLRAKDGAPKVVVEVIFDFNKRITNARKARKSKVFYDREGNPIDHFIID